MQRILRECTTGKLQHYKLSCQIIARPPSQHTIFVHLQGRAGGLASMCSCAGMVLPDHQPFLPGGRTHTCETTSPSSWADEHVLARPPALPHEQTNTCSQDHQPLPRNRAVSHLQDSHKHANLLVIGSVYTCTYMCMLRRAKNTCMVSYVMYVENCSFL